MMDEEPDVVDVIAVTRVALMTLKLHKDKVLAALKSGRLKQEDKALLKHATQAFIEFGAATEAYGDEKASLTINDLPDAVLLRVFEFLGGRQSCRVQLGILSTVSRRWRTVSRLDEIWKPICLELWPVMWSAPPLKDRPGCTFTGESGYYRLCRYRARCLREPGLVIVDPKWPSRYDISFEMHDRSDGLCLFSGQGPMVYQEWHNQHENRTILRMGAPGACVVATPFAAASRGSCLRDIRQYFSLAHLPDQKTSLCFRVVAIDRLTGREALLYESAKHTDRHVQDAANGWPVPPSSVAVTDHAGTWLCPKAGGSVPPMRALFDFTVVPVEDSKPGVPAQERLYTVHCAQVNPPTNTITHVGIVGLVFLGHVHEVGILLASLEWV